MQGRGGRQEMSGQWAALNKMDLPPSLDTRHARYCDTVTTLYQVLLATLLLEVVELFFVTESSS